MISVTCFGGTSTYNTTQRDALLNWTEGVSTNYAATNTVTILDTALTTSGTNDAILTHSASDIEEAHADEINQYGAAGYSASTNVAVLTGVWTDAPASFIIPYSSGFEYVSNSTIRYVNGTKAFLFGGSCSLTSGAANKLIEVGIETNGVYLVGSTSGARKFSTTTDSGSMSYAIPITISSNDTVGLVIKCVDADQTITINTWQSWAIRF